MNTAPVIITTWNGLVQSMQELPPVIYIDFCLFRQNEHRIHTLLIKRAYRKFRNGNRGVFYVRKGSKDITIADPLDIQ